MKELKTISDEKLLRQIQSGNDDAMECLLERYRDMVRKEARRFFLAGGDEEDLIQEGMIGLFKAVTSYQEEKNTSFSTFAYLCVQRQIYTTITAFNRKKHIPLNTAISLFEVINPLIMRFRGFAGRSEMIRKVKVKIREIKRRLKTDVLSLLYKAADGS